MSEEQFKQLSQQGWREVIEPGVPTPLDAGDTLLTVSADVAKKIGLAKDIYASPQALASARGYTIVADLAPGAGEKLVSLLGSAPVSGSVNGNSVKLTFQGSAGGQQGTVEYVGSVDGAKMSGTVKLGSAGEGTFTGSKK